MPTTRNPSKWIWILLSFVVISVGLVRIRLLDVPLERDEGEYAYMGRLLLDGIPPYSEATNMKFPGIYFAYAVILSIFPQTHTGIHFALLIVNLISTLLLFQIGRTLLNQQAALIASASFAVLTLSYQVEGLWANAEHFVVFFALAGTMFLQRSIQQKSPLVLAASGLSFGLAFLTKQHGAFFVLFGLVCLIGTDLRRQEIRGRMMTRAGLFLLSSLLPLLLALLYFLSVGVFDRFYFWTFTYALEYASQGSLSDAPRYFFGSFKPLFHSTMLLWLLAFVGLPAALLSIHYRGVRFFSFTFFLFSLVAVFPGLVFRPHYFILVLPAVSVLVAIGTDWLYHFFSRLEHPAVRFGIPTFVVLTALLSSFFAQKDIMFDLSPRMISRITFGGNPFPESPEIARFIREQSSPEDKIGILGSEPQVFFYANRRSATKFIYMYPLMEDHPYALSMQREMIDDLQHADPKMLLYVNVRPSWLQRSTSHELIFEWFATYKRRYEIVGLVEIRAGDEEPLFHRGKESASVNPQSPYWIAIYKRKESA